MITPEPRGCLRQVSSHGLKRGRSTVQMRLIHAARLGTRAQVFSRVWGAATGTPGRTDFVLGY
jgi:hypothetical protein